MRILSTKLVPGGEILHSFGIEWFGSYLPIALTSIQLLITNNSLKSYWFTNASKISLSNRLHSSHSSAQFYSDFVLLLIQISLRLLIWRLFHLDMNLLYQYMTSSEQETVDRALSSLQLITSLPYIRLISKCRLFSIPYYWCINYLRILQYLFQFIFICFTYHKS